MYDWRRMSPEERQQTLEKRRTHARPWHSPPHRFSAGQYLLSAICFQHAPILAHSAERLDHFTDLLLDTCTPHTSKIFAWCILPNHYHILLHTPALKPLLTSLGRLHGRTSYHWNLEEKTPGRQNWHACTDRQMRSHAHLMASINYLHHNPVKHGYVERWQDWPWSSANHFLKHHGHDHTKTLWQKFPIKDYGIGWDD